MNIFDSETLAGLVDSQTGSSERVSVMVWFRYPQKKSSSFLKGCGKWIITPNRQSGSPFGNLVLSNRSFTEVLRLFSLTLARMGQESMERNRPVICSNWMSSRTRDFLICWRESFVVSLKKEESLSTKGEGC